MAHIGQELGFGAVGDFGLAEKVLQICFAVLGFGNVGIGYDHRAGGAGLGIDAKPAPVARAALQRITHALIDTAGDPLTRSLGRAFIAKVTPACTIFKETSPVSARFHNLTRDIDHFPEGIIGEKDLVAVDDEQALRHCARCIGHQFRRTLDFAACLVQLAVTGLYIADIKIGQHSLTI